MPLAPAKMFLQSDRFTTGYHARVKRPHSGYKRGPCASEMEIAKRRENKFRKKRLGFPFPVRKFSAHISRGGAGDPTLLLFVALKFGLEERSPISFMFE